jgi:16S rRNA (cytidine1402-2'-O)-methyltransferase
MRLSDQGCLYVVATPIGNLGDMSARAIEVLRAVNVVAAEDTRHSRGLMDHFGISTRMIPLHDHNEQEKVQGLLETLEGGGNIAVISDAGTPLISDPGYRLVRAAREAGYKVVPVPGPCALIAALSVAGLPSDRFCFEGFLPSKAQARQTALGQLASESRSLIFYEAPHRIVECLSDMQYILGGDRHVVLARELTKTFESIHGDRLDNLLEWIKQDSNRQRGEFVVMVEGQRNKPSELDAEQGRVLDILMQELPLKQAAGLASRITGVKKNQLYDEALRRSAQQRNE